MFLRLWDEMPRDTERVYVLNSIGTIYFNLSTYDKALQYYLRALPLSEQIKDSNSIGTTAVNIGEVESFEYSA